MFLLQRDRKERKHYTDDWALGDEEIEGRRSFRLEDKMESDRFPQCFVKEMVGLGMLMFGSIFVVVWCVGKSRSICSVVIKINSIIQNSQAHHLSTLSPFFITLGQALHKLLYAFTIFFFGCEASSVCDNAQGLFLEKPKKMLALLFLLLAEIWTFFFFWQGS